MPENKFPAMGDIRDYSTIQFPAMADLSDYSTIEYLLKRAILEKYSKIVNSEFFERMLKETLKPYQARSI